MIVKRVYPIAKLKCASCANSVEKLLNKTQGIHKTEVNYANKKVTIEFDEETISEQKIKKIVKNAGFDIEINAMTSQEIQFQEQLYIKQLTRTFVGCLLVSIPVFVISMFHLHFENHSYVQGILTTFVLFFFGREFFMGAYRQLCLKSANMDTLVALSTAVAYGYSWSNIFFEDFWRQKGIEPYLYFEASVMIVTFVLLGKLLEEKAKGKTSDAIRKLMSLRPTSVVVQRGNDWEEILINQVMKGDVVLVKPGQKIAVDGVVIQGESYVDESMITGEPLPVSKIKDNEVFSGTINQLGSLLVRANKVGKETLLAQIIHAVEQAQASKAPIQKIVDKVSGIFVPIIILIAIISFILWNIFHGQGFVLGLQAFVTTLVIACPCALGLATPTAIMVAIGKGAEKGILIKNAESLQLAGQIQAVVLDKTGTITLGKPLVVNDVWKDKDTYLPILYSLEYHSEHPLAQAIVKHWEHVSKMEISDFQSFAGKGVQAKVNNELYRVGSLSWITSFGISISTEYQQIISDWQVQGSLVIMATSDDIVAIISISDAIKDTSSWAIQQLQKLGIEVHMLTGDQPKTALHIAQKVGISSVHSQMTPSDKQNFIKKIQSKGQVVAMVGDGINDTQALAQADVSIAMGRGSDIAIDVAHITLISSDLLKIPQAIRLSQMTLMTIKQNLFWAFIYNIIGIPIAAGALYAWGILLNPMIAAMAMTFSSVSVVVNSLLLKYKKIEH